MKYQITERVKVRRSIGRRTWNLLGRLPFGIRAPIIRRLFKLEDNLPEDLVFKRAETQDEIEQAFRVAYEAFYERGLVEETENRLRITKFHALPTSAIMIAKQGDEVIATLTVVVDSALGLPLEKLWSVDDLRRSSIRLAEISTLAIARPHRSQRGKLLLPLTNFMYRYCRQVLGVDTIVAAVHPEVRDFYRAVLLFNDIADGEIRTYEFVKGAAAAAGYLRIAEIPETYRKVYGHKPKSRNLHHFFAEQPFPQFQIPDNTAVSATQFSYTPQAFETYFKSHSDVFHELTEEEKRTLANYYPLPVFQKIISNDEQESVRSHPRFTVALPAHFMVDGNSEQASGTVLEVSRSGLKMAVPEDFKAQVGQEVMVEVHTVDESSVPLTGEVVWYLGDYSQVGIRFQKWLPQTWISFVQEFENKLHQIARADSETEQKLG